MHLLPRALFRSKEVGGTDSKHKGREPKLNRCKAFRNIDFDASSSSSSSLDEFGYLRTPSPEISLIRECTSFRVEGIDSLDRIYRRLGLSGPEDFEIPSAAWEVMGADLRCDMFPTFQSSQIESERSHEAQRANSPNAPKLPLIQECDGVCGVLEGCSITVGGGGNFSKIKGFVPLTPKIFTTSDNRCLDTLTSLPFGSDVLHIPPQTNVEELKICSITVGASGASNCGIKGFRPPPILLSTSDDGCSDLSKSLAPENDGRSSSLIPAKEVGGMSFPTTEVSGVRFGETVVLSGSSSYSASNDDDSASITSELMSSNSLIERFTPGITHWDKGGPIGRGTFGSVYEGIADGGFFFAVKEVSLLEHAIGGNDECVYQLEQEIALLSKFKHENIVRYLGTYRDESKFCIFLELVSKGSLQKLYKSYNLKDFHVHYYTKQILQGLKYLHEQEVVHRDIKCANILVDVGGTVKLADFGLAKVSKLNDLKSLKGTPSWMAPEVVKNHGYGLPADIWSLGCTVLEMLTGQIPYSHLECVSVLFSIGSGELPHIPSTLSSDARDFIIQCLQIDPSLRPSAAQLLRHPFISRPPLVASPRCVGGSRTPVTV